LKQSGYAYEAKDLKRDLGFRLILFVSGCKIAKGLNRFAMEEVNQDCRNNL